MTTSPPPPSRSMNIAFWGFQILIAAVFIFSGVDKLLTLQPEVVTNFDKVGLGQGFRYFTGGLELVGGVGLLFPRLSALAGAGLMVVMAGAAVAHLTVLPPRSFVVVPLFLAGMLALIVKVRWPRMRALLAHARAHR